MMKKNLIRVTFEEGGKEYTYDAGPHNVKIGDHVVVRSSYSGAESRVRVVGLGSDYVGPIAPIDRVDSTLCSEDPVFVYLFEDDDAKCSSSGPTKLDKKGVCHGCLRIIRFDGRTVMEYDPKTEDFLEMIEAELTDNNDGEGAFHF